MELLVCKFTYVFQKKCTVIQFLQKALSNLIILAKNFPIKAIFDLENILLAKIFF